MPAFTIVLPPNSQPRNAVNTGDGVRAGRAAGASIGAMAGAPPGWVSTKRSASGGAAALALTGAGASSSSRSMLDGSSASSGTSTGVPAMTSVAAGCATADGAAFTYAEGLPQRVDLALLPDRSEHEPADHGPCHGAGPLSDQGSERTSQDHCDDDRHIRSHGVSMRGTLQRRCRLNARFRAVSRGAPAGIAKRLCVSARFACSPFESGDAGAQRWSKPLMAAHQGRA